MRARAVAKQLDDSDLAIIDKRRPQANQAQVMHIIGDVKDRTCVIIDDMVDTAGTLCKAAEALKAARRNERCCLATHPVLSGPAIANLKALQLDELVVTDTIPLSEEAKQCALFASFRWPICWVKLFAEFMKMSRSALFIWTNSASNVLVSDGQTSSPA